MSPFRPSPVEGTDWLWLPSSLPCTEPGFGRKHAPPSHGCVVLLGPGTVRKALLRARSLPTSHPVFHAVLLTGSHLPSSARRPLWCQLSPPSLRPKKPEVASRDGHVGSLGRGTNLPCPAGRGSIILSVRPSEDQTATLGQGYCREHPTVVITWPCAL